MPWATIQLVTTSGLISWAIRRATFSQFSHVDYVLDAGTAHEQLLGAHWGGGVQIRQPNYEKFTTRRRLAVDVTDETKRLLENFLFQQVGKPYDTGAIANLLIQRQWRAEDKWFCSELIARAFEQAGAPLLNPHMEVWRISPRDLQLSPYLR
jgi:uncharacterized protein YycO